MTGGTLLGDGRLIVGVRGTGVFKQVSGKVAYNSHLTLGYYPGSVGRYTMDNDAQLYVGGNEYIGDDTVGTFIQSNGHHAVMGGINLAQESGSTGAFDMHGGELSIFSSLAVGREGPGTFLQDGGFVDVGGILYVPYGYDDNHVAGTYELRGADTRLLVRGDVFYVGASASTTGTFTHVDGRVDVLGELRIANGTDSRGAYSLDGAGAELIRCDVAYVGYGTDSTGTFVQSNGTHLSKVSGGLIVGNGTRSYGRYDYLGGELVLDGSLYVSYGTDSTGVFVHADGLTTRCQDLSVGYNGGGRGTYTMGTNGGSGTRLTALNGLYVGRGEGQQGFFTQNNGSLEAGGPFGIATATSSSGRYDLVAGDLLVHDSGCYVGYGAGAHAAFVQGTNAGWVRIYGANATYSFGLALGLGAGSSGTYDLQGGNLFVEDGIHLGYTDDSTGTFFQADGTYVRCNEMRVGGYADSEGTYTMGTTNGSGTLLRNVGAFHMGENAGNGTFYQNNGTHLMYGSLIMGYQADGAAVSTTRYVMAEPAERLNVREGGLYVGYLADSDAEFVQNGEVLVANANTGGDLFVGYGSGANGRYLQEAGDLKVYDDFNIGYLASSVGAFTQSAGSDITVIGTMHLGYNSPAQGTLTINGDGVTVRESVHVGRAGSGIVTQNTGEIVAFDHIYLGSESAGEGKVVLNGGTLRSKLDLYVGEDGDGTLSQAAGSLVDVGRNLRVGYNGAGTYNLGAGSLQIVSTYGFASDTYGVILGYNSGGEGVLTLDGGTVTEVGNGTLLGVGRVSGAEGSISGWGTIDLTGKLLNNGVVTADGGGTNRDLDLSAFRLAWLETGADRYGNCYNSVDNDPGDSNGWYAVSGGRLLLPTLFITDAAAPWYWGEQGSEGAAGVPDLVNSLKIEFSNLQYGGPLDIALLGDGHTALGNTSGSLVGSWLFQPDSLMEFDSVDVTVRYDEDLAAALEGGEGELKGYSSDGSTWSEVTIDLDTDANTIELTGLGSFGALIAVGQDIQYGSGAPKGSVLFIQ